MIDEIFMVRANFYAFLSRMFVEEPPFELAEDIVSRKFQIAKATCLNTDFSEGLILFEKFAKSYKDAVEIHENLSREFTRLFIGPVPAMFPYESKYIDGSLMTKSLLKIKEEYRRTQLKKVQDYHEPEDHIAVELGFMSNLCLNNGKDSLKNQRDFLKDHLSKWAPAFCDELYEKSNNDFFRGIGKITKGFLNSERELLDELYQGKG